MQENYNNLLEGLSTSAPLPSSLPFIDVELTWESLLQKIHAGVHFVLFFIILGGNRMLL